MNTMFFFIAAPLFCITLQSAEPFLGSSFQPPMVEQIMPTWCNDSEFFRWCGELTRKEVKREKVGTIIIVKPYLNRVYLHKNKIGNELFERWHATFMKLKTACVQEQELIDTKAEMCAVIDACERNMV